MDCCEQCGWYFLKEGFDIPCLGLWMYVGISMATAHGSLSTDVLSENIRLLGVEWKVNDR
jgi:hypothetical protein